MDCFYYRWLQEKCELTVVDLLGEVNAKSPHDSMLKLWSCVQIEASTLNRAGIIAVLAIDHVLEVVLHEYLYAHTVQVFVVPNVDELKCSLCIKPTFLLFKPSFHQLKIEIVAYLRYQELDDFLHGSTCIDHVWRVDIDVSSLSSFSPKFDVACRQNHLIKIGKAQEPVLCTTMILNQMCNVIRFEFSVELNVLSAILTYELINVFIFDAHIRFLGI